MSDQKPRVDSIVTAAAKLKTQAELAAYLDQACGDDQELRAQIERLLSINEQINRTRNAIGAPEVTVDATPDVTLPISALTVPEQTIDCVPNINLRKAQSKGSQHVEQIDSAETLNQKFSCRYQLEGEIARGGMGAILKGRDTDLGRELAIKILLDSHRDNPQVVQRFIEEAQIGGQLQHPGIAPVYELGQFADKRPFFSMKLVKGETLARLLTDRTNLSVDLSRFIGIFEQICQTMAYAHSRGVIHRDLKPANIMVGAFGEVQVMDWGLAKVLPLGDIASDNKSTAGSAVQSAIQTLRSGSVGESGRSLNASGSETQLGSVIGTPAFMPPEQALGEIEHLDKRADVFGLGAILCVILTGQPPYIGASGHAVYRLAAAGKLDDCFARLDACGADAELISLAKRCLAPDARNRLHDASAVAQSVTDYLRSVEKKLRQAELERAAEAARVVELRRRRKLLYAIAGMLLLGLIVAGFAAIHFRTLEEKQRTLAIEKSALATTNERLADERETERKAAVAARVEAEAASKRADAQATLATNRANEIRRTLYAGEMNRAAVSLKQVGGTRIVKELLDHWRPAQDEEDLRGWEWFYLRANLERAELVLEHPAQVLAADWSPDGKRVFTGGQDSIVRTWDTDTGRLVSARREDGGMIRGLEVSPSGDRLATLHQTGVVLVRKIDTGEVILNVKTSNYPGGGLRFASHQPIAWSPDGSRIAFAISEKLSVLDTSTGKILKTLDVPRDDKFLFWLPRGDRVVIRAGQQLIIWNMDNWEHETLFRSQGGGIHDIALGPDGTLLLSDEKLVSVDASSKAISTLHTPANNLGLVLQFDISADGRIAFSDLVRQIQIIDGKDSASNQTLAGHSDEVTDIQWSPVDDRIMSVSNDQTVRIWRTNALNDPNRTLPKATSVDWRPGTGDIAWGHGKTASIYDYPEVRPVSTFDVRSGLRVAWKSDGSRLAVGCPMHITFIDPSGKAKPMEWNGEDGAVAYNGQLAWEPESNRLAIINLFDWIKIVDPQDGTVIREWKGLGYAPLAAWHPRGQRIAIVHNQGIGRCQITIADLESKHPVQELQLSEVVTNLAWHPSGDLLATARVNDFVVEIWNVATGEKVADIGGGSLQIGGLAWTPDGNTLAIGSQDGTIKFWKRNKGQIDFTLIEDGDVQHLEWDESGTDLAIQTNQGVWIRSAGAGYASEDSAHAIPTLDRQVAVNPNRALYRLRRAELLEKSQRWKEASADWESLVKIYPGDEWYTARSIEAKLNLMEPEAALARLESRLVENPSDTIAARLLAKRLLKDMSPDNWSPLRVESAVSEGGALLLPQRDGSLLATGKNPYADTYKVTGLASLERISAVRLETIMDNNLPERLSGRAYNGNFLFGDLTIEMISADESRSSQKIPIGSAWADHATAIDHRIFEIQNAIDDDIHTGWNTWPAHDRNHQAVFALQQVQDTARARILVRLSTATEQGRYVQYNLGRFRLSVTDRPSAARIAAVQAALEGDPTAQTVWLQLGILHSLRNEPAKAANYFNRALHVVGDELARAKVLAEAALDPAAFTLLSQANSSELVDPLHHAGLLQAARQFNKSIVLTTRALQASPDARPIRLARGRALALANRWREAQEDLSATLTPDHQSLEDWALLAEACEKTQRWEDAIKYWKQLLKLSPSHEQYRLRLESALVETNQWDEVISMFQKQFDDRPEDTLAWLRLATVLVRSGKLPEYEATRAAIARPLSNTPVEHSVQQIKACLLTPMGEELREKLPIQQLSELLDSANPSPETKQWLLGNRPWLNVCMALFKVRTGELAEVEALIQPTLVGYNNIGESKATGLAIHALALAQQGKVEPARSRLEECQQMIQLIPGGTPDSLVATILANEARRIMDDPKK